MSEPIPMDILLVEDNPRDLELTMRILQKTGPATRITVARDGAEALALFTPAPERAPGLRTPIPRLILLDLKMSKADGVEVLQGLKRNPLTQVVPIVVLTSSREPRDLIRCYQAGANSYIVKPVTHEQFETAIQQTVRYWLMLNVSPYSEG